MDPLKLPRQEFADALGKISSRLGLAEVPEIEKTRRYGYFSARFHKYKIDPTRLRDAVEELSNAGFQYISGLSAEGLYVNAGLNARRLGELVFEAVAKMGRRYGFTEECRLGSFLVEHTSANPIHPLHIGHGRNAILGDSLARLLRFCDNRVEVHFYVDDCGVQVMYATIGYNAVRDEAREWIERAKPDLVVGHIYSATNAVAEIGRLKKEVERAQDDEHKRSLIGEIDEWVAVLKRLMESEGDLVAKVVERLGQRDVAGEAVELNRRYEVGDPEAKRAVREVVDLVLRGQRETLARLGIEIDKWDYESELAVWSGEASRIVEELQRKWPQYVEHKGGAVVFRADKFVEDFKLWDVLDLPKFIPPVTLTRSDGTTLYVTRDVAYALWQARQGFDKVVRVISTEQTHEQAHVRIILYALGFEDAAKKIVHYAYEMVNLPGMKMSARRGRYISLDEILDEAAERSASLVKEKSPEIAGVIAEKVGVGSVRYAFLSTSPRKPIEFRWEVVLNLRQNSGTFLQYTYVRAYSILEKAPDVERASVPERMLEEEKELLVKIAEWPSVVREAVRALRPDYVAEYLDGLALLFNSYYEKAPVLKAEEGVREFRIALVNAVKTVLEAGFYILGIPTLTKM
ncbi:arginyl-tRNA synthetase [Pyrobaculum oguniense TE7]|uniref:Arginine--tRNA ligase n=1 Tax=Pyrobaculum oguniense (strain DSM 13380 / JCM 10595 / TE7) TaxID=698757 RepID=H6Q704_PYROT|nr:arginyl-tRNA synthetase [Pyrobaculum oguniense TE7]